MKLAGIYSFNGAKGILEGYYAEELRQVQEIIQQVDAAAHRTKVSKEKTMRDKLLYSPASLNKAFKQEFQRRGWKQDNKIFPDYPTEFYTDEYSPSGSFGRPFREIDFLKNRLGVEVQFGKYAFMVYNVCAKMTIFHKLDIIDTGIEIVPVKDLADQMSTGVSFFEQFVWDLEHRGVSNIDIPVLILGVAP